MMENTLHEKKYYARNIRKPSNHAVIRCDVGIMLQNFSENKENVSENKCTNYYNDT